jgi:hypothetical protein
LRPFRPVTDIQGPDIRDICYATQNRQSAVRDLSKLVDVILVVGAANGSNSNRLREIGTEVGVASYLIADGSELNLIGSRMRSRRHHGGSLGARGFGRRRDRALGGSDRSRSRCFRAGKTLNSGFQPSLTAG